MYFDTKSIGGGIEILASNDYQAVPVTVTETMKAGTPVTQAGAKTANAEGAIGILLYDVDKDVNPNGAVVVDGIINYDKCKASAGADLTATADALAKALPNIVVREKIGDKDTKTYTSGGVGAGA